MRRQYQEASDGDQGLGEVSGGGIELLIPRGEERRNSPDMRFRAAQALMKETLTLCEQSPDQLLRTAFRSALTNVIASYGLQDKDRGLLMRMLRRQSGLASTFVAALDPEDEMRPKGAPLRGRDMRLYALEEMADLNLVPEMDASNEHYHPRNEI